MELYIHIPFCKQKCLYCDFPSWDSCADSIPDYIDALKKDLVNSLEPSFVRTLSSENNVRNSLSGASAANNRSGCGKNGGAEPNLVPIETVYIGGGTPSFIDASYIEEIMELVKSRAIISENAEITLEANPCTVTKEKAQRYLACGINRISMGVQSFNDGELRLLGRAHDAAAAHKAFYVLREAGFNNISIDLIHGLPRQTAPDFLASLDKAIDLAPEHISAYGLIIEAGTPFNDIYADWEPDEDEQVRIYTHTVERLESSEYFQYEISNFAKRGFESRHNLGYWSGEEYLGCGLGATGYAGSKRVTKEKKLEEYISNPLKSYTEHITAEDKKKEFIFLGMRRKSGINAVEYEKIFKEEFPENYKKIFKKYSPEYVTVENNSYRFTVQGFLVSNTILSEFM